VLPFGHGGRLGAVRPTTIAFFGPFIYAVNAGLTTTPTPDTTYTVVRVP
jgi:hypothetical protein